MRLEQGEVYPCIMDHDHSDAEILYGGYTEAQRQYWTDRNSREWQSHHQVVDQATQIHRLRKEAEQRLAQTSQERQAAEARLANARTNETWARYFTSWLTLAGRERYLRDQLELLKNHQNEQVRLQEQRNQTEQRRVEAMEVAATLRNQFEQQYRERLAAIADQSRKDRVIADQERLRLQERLGQQVNNNRYQLSMQCNTDQRQPG